MLKRLPTIILFVIFVGAGCFMYFVFSHAVSLTKWNKITESMTKAEVQQILGTPHFIGGHTSPDPAASSFNYGGFPRYQWCTMHVYFGGDDRVIRTFHDH